MKITNGVPFREVYPVIQTLALLSPFLWMILWYWSRQNRGKKSRTAPQLLRQLTHGKSEQIFGASGKWIILAARFIILSILGHAWKNQFSRMTFGSPLYSSLPFPLYSFFTIWNFILLTVIRNTFCNLIFYFKFVNTLFYFYFIFNSLTSSFIIFLGLLCNCYIYINCTMFLPELLTYIYSISHLSNMASISTTINSQCGCLSRFLGKGSPSYI